MILGAHSFADFHAKNSYFQYAWTRAQVGIFNNQMFRHISSRPQYFGNCIKLPNGKREMLLVGDPYGREAPTSWRVWQLRHTKNGGPFQWFHIYNRCPASNNCSAVNWEDVYGPSYELDLRAEPPTKPECCQNLEPGMYCQPECARYTKGTKVTPEA